MFPKSLKRAALTWFNNLEFESIHFFEELINQLEVQFASTIKIRKVANYLLTIVQIKSEFLKAYTKCFNREIVGIPNRNGSIEVEAFRKGLNRLYDSIMENELETMINSMYQAAKYIKLEED